MKNIIETKLLSKEFKTPERGEGLIGHVRTLLTRSYKTKKALSNVSLDVKEGEFLGVMGPNGAGKSTLIKILTGILTPTSGRARILGKVPYRQRQEYVKNIGVVFGQRTQLWWDLPVKESFELQRHMFEIPKDVYKQNLDTFINILGIGEYLNTPVRRLSLGERMRCDLAASLLHNPKIVYLDEPTIGLDVEAKHRIREFLKSLNKRGTTVILTTHDMGDIEELCKRVVIIDKGKKIFDGPVSDLRKKFGKERLISVEFHEDVDVGRMKLEGVKVMMHDGPVVRLSIDTRKTSVSDVTRRIFARHSIHDITIEDADIEQIIREIYSRGL